LPFWLWNCLKGNLFKKYVSGGLVKRNLPLNLSLQESKNN
jgi:hypothetical protein